MVFPQFKLYQICFENEIISDLIKIKDLRSAALVLQEFEDMEVRVGEPGGGDSGEDDAVGLTGLGDFPGGDADGVVRGVR